MPDAQSFETWCRRLQDSDREALAEVFEAMHDSIFRYIRSITKDGAVSRDITQDVFIRLWDARESLDPSQSLEAYLFRMARNRAYNHERNRRTRTDKEEDIREDSVAQPSAPVLPDAHVDATLLEANLAQWIEALPDRQREALSLSRFEGLSHDDVADVMDISPRTVNNHIVRALKTLRERIRAFEPDLLDHE